MPLDRSHTARSPVLQRVLVTRRSTSGHVSVPTVRSNDLMNASSVNAVGDATRQTGGMVGADPFVGRDEQLAELAAAADGARLGRSGIVLVAGEAGIGKTRLVQEASAAAAAPTVWATCWDGDGAPAFWPWIQVIRGCIMLPGGRQWRDSGAPAVAAICALL